MISAIIFILFLHDLILVNKEPIVVELLHNLLKVIGRIDLLVNVLLSPFLQPLLQRRGGSLEAVVQHLGEEEVMDHVCVCVSDDWAVEAIADTL